MMRTTNLHQSQQMSSVAQRFLRIQRHTPVALLVERDLIQSSEVIVNAIRGGVMVRLRQSELTDEERRQAYRNLFDPCQYE